MTAPKKSPIKAAPQAATPRARRLASEWSIDLKTITDSQEDGRIHAADVLAVVEPDIPPPLATHSFQVEFRESEAWWFIEQLQQNTLPGEASPQIGDIFIKAVAAAAEICPTVLGSTRSRILGIGQIGEPACWQPLPNVSCRSLRDLSQWTADLTTNPAHPMTQHREAPTLLVVDAHRWGLTDLSLSLPSTAHALAVLASTRSLTSDHSDHEGHEGNERAIGRNGVIRLHIRPQFVAPATALRFIKALKRLMEQLDWVLC